MRARGGVRAFVAFFAEKESFGFQIVGNFEILQIVFSAKFRKFCVVAFLQNVGNFDYSWHKVVMNWRRCRFR